MSLNKLILNVIKREGGYVNHPSDPGGETKFGISKRAYPNLDIKGLTEEQAEALYLKDYVAPLKLSELPENLRPVLLDFAVNSGVSAAVKDLQRVLSVTVDGKIGPATVKAANEASASFAGSGQNPRAAQLNLPLLLTLARWDFLYKLPTFPSFGRGWTFRLFEVLAESSTYSGNSKG